MIHTYACACGDTLTLREGAILDCCERKGYVEPVGGSIGRLLAALEAMEKTINTLRLEVPAVVMVDVTEKWAEVCTALQGITIEE